MSRSSIGLPPSIVYVIIVLILFVVANAFALQPVAIVFSVLVLLGVLTRQRMAWQWGYLLAGIGGIVYFIIGIGVLSQPAMAKDNGALTAMGAMVGGALLVSVSVAMRRTSARAYFDLICPQCGIATSKSANFLFSQARCKECGLIWSSSAQFVKTAPAANPYAIASSISPIEREPDQQLKRAGWWLIGLGLLTVIFNMVLLVNLPREVESESLKLESQAQSQRQYVKNLPELKELMFRFGYVVYGGTVGMGVIFIILGCLMESFPLPIAVSSLVLYIFVQLGFMILNPANICSGIIMKVVVLSVLINAVRAALIHQKRDRMIADYDEGRRFSIPDTPPAEPWEPQALDLDPAPDSRLPDPGWVPPPLEPLPPSSPKPRPVTPPPEAAPAPPPAGELVEAIQPNLSPAPSPIPAPFSPELSLASKASPSRPNRLPLVLSLGGFVLMLFFACGTSFFYFTSNKTNVPVVSAGTASSKTVTNPLTPPVTTQRPFVPSPDTLPPRTEKVRPVRPPDPVPPPPIPEKPEPIRPVVLTGDGISKNWQVIFRSHDPIIWDQEINKGDQHVAKPLSSVTDDIRHLRMRRDSDFVIIPMSRDRLKTKIHDGRYGWLGTAAKDSGALHLGIYDRQTQCRPGEISIHYLPWHQGWGFGHIQFRNNIQGYCWDCKAVAPCVFEIAVKPGELTETENMKVLRK